MSVAAPSAQAMLRIVLIVVGVVLCLYLIYLLRQPITWVLISVFLAVALSRPVNYLNRYMRRGLAIAGVYLGMLAAVVALGLLLIPPIVTQVNKLADNAPSYAQDVRDSLDTNHRSRTPHRHYTLPD